jgi:hypothetical protein
MTTLTKHARSHAYAASAFEREAFDPLCMREPVARSATVCNALPWFALPGVLRAPDGDPAPGGKTFSQDEVNTIVQERVGKLKVQLDAATAALSELDSIKTRLAEADAAREEQLEQEKLKGKSELEKLQHNLQKSTEKQKQLEAEWQAKVAAAEQNAAKAADAHRGYVQRHLVSSALADAGIAKGASKAATLTFLSEAQIELDDNLEPKSVAVGGKSFAKLAEAAKQYLTDNPYFAGKSDGGSGAPRSPLHGNGAQLPVDQHANIDSLLSAGLSAQAQAKNSS